LTQTIRDSRASAPALAGNSSSNSIIRTRVARMKIPTGIYVIAPKLEQNSVNRDISACILIALEARFESSLHTF
jgi:hypothetical protein